jgi:hypothetical protein
MMKGLILLGFHEESKTKIAEALLWHNSQGRKRLQIGLASRQV